MVNIVVDFVGFYFQGQCIIKEFVVARILDKLIEVEDQILIDTTALPIDSNALYDDQFQMFYKKSSIRWDKRGNHTREDIIAKIESLRHHNIYLRDKIHATFLADYLNLSINSFNSLSDSTDFDPYNEIMKTNCRNHQNTQSYCVKNNVMIMAEWLKESSEPKERLAIINYVGNSVDNDIDNFKITKLRVHCFDNNGTVISDKLIFSASFNSIRNISVEEFERHKGRYREKYGVDYIPSFLQNLSIVNQFRKILLDNKIEFVFVENSTQKNHLLRLMGSSFNIYSLDNYGHFGSMEDDDSLKKAVNNMVDIVIRKKLYTIIRQQNETIDIDDDNTE